MRHQPWLTQGWFGGGDGGGGPEPPGPRATGGKVIMFGGQYREKEIDLTFSVNPGLDPFQHITLNTYLVKANGTMTKINSTAYFDAV